MRRAIKHRSHQIVHRSKPKSRLGTVGKIAAYLASPIPDVELLIAGMANPESGIKFVLGIAKRAGRRISEVQSVLFDKLKWNSDTAKTWLQDHGFTTSGKDEGATFWRFRQNDPKRYKEFRTVVPGTRHNPTPGESISSYEEHLATTTDPDFQRATPDEQAAAMTAQDLSENPEFGVRVLGFKNLTGRLTTQHTASSYGQPVLVLHGRVYGPADVYRGASGALPPFRLRLEATGKKPSVYQRIIERWNAQVPQSEFISPESPEEVDWESSFNEPNPESAAADLYKEFHGQPPAETLEIVTEKIEHGWLTQLGTLVELKVQTVTNLDATFRFNKEAPELCSSEDGRQLYIEGGDQALDLKTLKMDGEQWVKDSMTIGVLYEITYRTRKGFQKFKTTDYFHKLGEESGVQPFLLYDPRNKLLSISGGQYQTKPEGIVN